MQAAIRDSGFDVIEVDDLGEFQPSRDGSVLVVGGESVRKSVGSFAEDHPFIPVVVVIPQLTLTSVALVVRSGATGVLDEDFSAESLSFVLRSATAGLTALPTRIVAAMSQLVPDPEDAATLVSQEELGWLRTMASGETVAELAERVGYSERAMFRQLKSLYTRLGVSNRTDALLWASRHQLLS